MPPPINKIIPVPREQLEQLLREAGSQQTIEQFLNRTEIQAAIQTNKLYQKRAAAARWSRIWLLASTLFSLGSFVSSPNPEDGIASLLLGGMTVLEFKVHSWFLQIDPRGPLWGFRNQCLFAFLFLAWGFYHYLVPPSAKELGGMGLGELGMGDLTAMVQNLERIFYAVVGTIGALGQTILAFYYRRASVSYSASTGRTSS